MSLTLGIRATQGARRRAGWTLIETWPTDITSWTDVQTPTETTGVSDPFSGSNAVTTGDDDSGSAEGHSKAGTTSLVVSELYRIRYYILKDADTSRFPEFQNSSGSGFAHWQLNTSTGATTIRATANWTSVTVNAVTAPINSAWWLVTLEFSPNATTPPTIIAAPAITASFGAVQVSATGTLTWYAGITLERAA